MRRLALLFTGWVWLMCVLVAPASWWLNSRILDEQAFISSMQTALGLEEVDRALTDQATAQVVNRTQGYVDVVAPALSGPAATVLTRLEPTIKTLVYKAVNSQPGDRAALAMSQQAHNVFVGWVQADSLGQPGLSADLGTGELRLDLQELMAGQQLSLGLVTVPLDAVDLGSLTVGVPMPPSWMRAPINWLSAAFLPAVLIAVAAGAVIVLLDRGRTRAVGWTALVTAGVCAVVAAVINAMWTVSGAADPEWTITAAIGSLLVQPWIQSYIVIVVAMLVLAAAAFGWDRHRFAADAPPDVVWSREH